MKCKHCDKIMEYGVALDPRSEENSLSGPVVHMHWVEVSLIEVLKCPECGHSEYQFCEVPPPGWTCSRRAGHDGPCAASPK